MKAIVLAACAAAFAAALPASAQVTTIGGSFAESCYRFAETHDNTMNAITTCNRAFGNEALTRDDEFATYVNRGIIWMLRRDFGSAEADFQRASAMFPKRSEPWLNKGVSHFKRGDSAGAIASFDKALALGTKVPELAYFGRALAHEDMGNVNAAYADLRRAAEIRPNWGDPARELARYQVRSR